MNEKGSSIEIEKPPIQRSSTDPLGRCGLKTINGVSTQFLYDGLIQLARDLQRLMIAVVAWPNQNGPMRCGARSKKKGTLSFTMRACGQSVPSTTVGEYESRQPWFSSHVRLSLPAQRSEKNDSKRSRHSYPQRVPFGTLHRVDLCREKDLIRLPRGNDPNEVWHRYRSGRGMPPDRQHWNVRFANRSFGHASKNQVAQSGLFMRSHYDQIGLEFFFDLEYRAGGVAAPHYKFTLGFGAQNFSCYRYLRTVSRGTACLAARAGSSTGVG